MIDNQHYIDFFQGYKECALWSSTENHNSELESYGEPLDAHYGIDDIDDDTAIEMESDCKNFMEENEIDLKIVCSMDGYDWSSAGHDLWLTRNGHGAGFWDRWDGESLTVEAAFERLTKWSKAEGSFDLDGNPDTGKVYSL